MNEISVELREVVERAAERLRAMPEPQPPSGQAPGQWSAKQVLGHLIDSAANNHARFVHAQFMRDLVFPGYDQEQWVAVQHYEAASWQTLVQLWESYNLHLAHVIAHMPEALLREPRAPHTLDRIAWRPVPADEPTTLEYLLRDYLGHLRDHLQQLDAAAQV